MAYKDTVSVTYDKATINTKTFTGIVVCFVTGNIIVPKTYTTTFTRKEKAVEVMGIPKGTISQPTFIGDVLISTGNYTPEVTSVSTVTTSTENKTATVSKASSETTTFTPERIINVTLTQTATSARVS